MARLSAAGLENFKKATKEKFGNLLPDELLDVYVVAYMDSGNDQQQAVTAMRKSNVYAKYYPGNLNPDGVTTKYNEAEYSQLMDGYKRKLEAVGVNPNVVLTDERKKQLVENIISPDAFGNRINQVYTQVITGVPAVKEFYMKNFGRELTDAEVIVSAIDPSVGEQIINGTVSAAEVVSQNVVRAQIGGGALLSGVEISLDAAEQLRQQGLDPTKARAAFNIAQNVQRAAASQGRSVPNAQDIVEGTQLGSEDDFKLVQNILSQQASQSSAAGGARRTQQGQVQGLIEQ